MYFVNYKITNGIAKGARTHDVEQRGGVDGAVAVVRGADVAAGVAPRRRAQQQRVRRRQDQGRVGVRLGAGLAAALAPPRVARHREPTGIIHFTHCLSLSILFKYITLQKSKVPLLKNGLIGLNKIHTWDIPSRKKKH